MSNCSLMSALALMTDFHPFRPQTTPLRTLAAQSVFDALRTLGTFLADRWLDSLCAQAQNCCAASRKGSQP